MGDPLSPCLVVTLMLGGRLENGSSSHHLHPNSTEAGSGSLIFQLCNAAKTKGEQTYYSPPSGTDESNFARTVSWKSGSELSGVREPSGKLTIHTNLAFMLYPQQKDSLLKKEKIE